MNKFALTAALLALSSSLAIAQTPPAEDKSLSTEAAKDHPGSKETGTTADPTAKSDDKSLSEKAAKDQPGTTGGTTADPTAKPADSSLQDKATKDQGSK